jgi:hypothetical protein
MTISWAIPRAQAQREDRPEPSSNGAAVVVVGSSIDLNQPFVTLSTGGLVWVRGQRFVVTQEPAPAAVVTEAPPPPPAGVATVSRSSVDDAIWVPGYWTHGEEGFVWVEGQHIAGKPGHAFVPPRWVFVRDHYLFFDGFFVPHRVWVRSFFNTFHYSGTPVQNSSNARDRGPYWPIGVSSPAVGSVSAKARSPYWPIGLGPPTVLNRRGATVVGLPTKRARR